MKNDQLQKELANVKKLQVCAEMFDVVGDLTRLKICWLLCHHPELCVGDIAEVLDLEISTVSHALRKLRQAGVVGADRRKKQIFYSLEKTSMCSFIKRSLA